MTNDLPPPPPLWPCDWPACALPAAQQAGDCPLCDRHLCRTHLRAPWHACPQPGEDWEAYGVQYAAAEARRLRQLCDRIDAAKLCARASALRGGVPCAADLSPRTLSALMGGQNCHAEIVFADGVRWLARFALPQPSCPPPAVRDWVLQSEAATLRFLGRHTRVPVPRVFDWAAESDPANPLGLGVGYILMEKLDGKPLHWQSATGEQQDKVLQQLADVYLELARHPFDRLGSLTFSDDAALGVQVQGLAQPSTFRRGQGPLGPFSSAAEGARAALELYVARMASGEITSACPTNAYLAHRFRLDVVGRLWAEEGDDGGDDGGDAGPFYLKHPDDKGDHILVNDAFDITAVIDWQWTQTVSRAEAFASPCMMWPVGKFYEGSNELAAGEVRLAALFRDKGRPDLARCVVEGRKIQRFFFDLGPACSSSDQETSDALLTGLRQAFGYGDEAWQAWLQGRGLEGGDGSGVQL